MNRVSSVITKVRPIKKLFLIDETDIDRFVAIIQSVTLEVAGISNLILINNGDLFTRSIKDFVNYHDPDVVLNCTSLNNNDLLQFFKIPSYSGDVAASISNSFSTSYSA